MENKKIILVPEDWFKSLLETANDFEQEFSKLDLDKSVINNKIHLKAAMLCGYAKSCESILKYNERV